jgi:hypothetical protein
VWSLYLAPHTIRTEGERWRYGERDKKEEREKEIKKSIKNI